MEQPGEMEDNLLSLIWISAPSSLMLASYLAWPRRLQRHGLLPEGARITGFENSHRFNTRHCGQEVQALFHPLQLNSGCTNWSPKLLSGAPSTYCTSPGGTMWFVSSLFLSRQEIRRISDSLISHIRAERKFNWGLANLGIGRSIFHLKSTTTEISSGIRKFHNYANSCRQE
jgi:hypothetical protein